MEEKNLQLCLKSHLKILMKLFLQSSYRLLNITMKFIKVFNSGQDCDLYKMDEIEKEAVGFPVICHHMVGKFTLGSITLFSALFILFNCIKKKV